MALRSIGPRLRGRRRAGARPCPAYQCAFGKWYYGGGTRLSRLNAYKAIDVAHEDLHHTYAEIYQTLFIEQRRPWPLRLLARRPLLKLSQSTRNDALIERLIAASKRLLESIGLLEQVIMSASEEEIQTL